jgi:hypothetical protein
MTLRQRLECWLGLHDDDVAIGPVFHWPDGAWRQHRHCNRCGRDFVAGTDHEYGR